MIPGTQIAYIPLHACGDINHKDVQFGFVTKQVEGGHFCRYWLSGKEGLDLRTRANSELTPNECLRKHQSVQQAVVVGWLAKIKAERERLDGLWAR